MSTLPIPSSVKQIYKQTKNTVLQVPEIERKVKEATSNEKWGPTSTQMREIAQATFSYHDLPIIMGAIFRRLNDHGKYWRHVYKSLLLIDYLLRNGSEQVIRECREHVVAIQTLNEFQYIDERDQDVGLSVRERAKLIVEILHDEKRLKVEREKAKNTAKKFMVGIGSEGSSGGGYGNDSYGYDNGGRGGYSANNDYDNSSSSSNTRYRDDDEEEDRYDSSSSNTKRYEEDSPSNYSNSTNNVSSSSSRSGGNRPRAASGERPSSSSSSTSGNVSSASSSGNRGATTGNLFSIDDVLTNTPTPQQSNSRHQEIDFFNTPSNNFNPFPNNTNNAFPPSNNFNNNTNNGFPPVNNNNTNTNTGFPPSNSFDNNNAFQSSTSQDNWASFDNNNASSSSSSTTTATTSENEKKEFDPWARADLFNLGGLKEGKQSGSGGNISSSASKTPMGALPGQKGNTNTPNFNTGGMGTGTGPSVTMGSMNNNMGGYNMGGPNMGMNMGGPNMGMNMGGPNMGMNMGGPNMGMNMGGPNMGGPNMGMNMGGQNMGYGANANMGYGNRPQSGFGGPMNMGNPQFQQQQQQQPGLQRGPSFTQQQPNNNSWNF